MADFDIEGEVKVDSSQADKAIGKTKKNAISLGAAFKKAGAGIKAGVAGVAVAFTAIAGGVFKAVKAYRVQELAVNELNQALKTQGIYSKSLSKEYQRNASELQKVTTFGDEAIISAQARLQSYLGEEKVTKELTASILDFASAQKIDLASAADLVGKSIGSSTNALGRYGISIDSSASKSEKAAAIQEALNTKFEGQAAAAASGTGAITQLNNRIGDVVEVIGKAALPVVRFITKELNNFLDEADDGQKAVGTLTSAFQGFTKVGIIVKNVFKAVGQYIGTYVGGIVATVTQLINGEFSQAFETAKTSMVDLGMVLVDGYKNTNAEIASLNEEFRKAELDKKKEAADEEIAIEQNKNEQIAENKSIADELQKQIEAEKAKQYQTDADARAAIDLAEVKRKVKTNNQIAKDTIKSSKAVAEAKAFFQSQEVKDTKTALDNLSSLTNSNSKELFALGKAAAYASAVINTAQGVTKALAQGGIFGPILGASVAVAGAVQLATISAQKFQKRARGGLVTGGIAGVDSVPSLLQPGETVVPSNNFEQLIRSFGGDVGGEGAAGETEIVLSLKDGLVDFIEAEVIERRALGEATI